MDNDGTLNWGAYYRPPLLKSNLGLQLMPNVGEGVTKPFFSGGGGGGSHLHLECAIPEPGSMSMTLARDSWFHGAGDSGRMFHGFIGGHHEHSSGYTAVLPETMRPSIGAGAHALHMLQLIDPLTEGKPPLVEDPCAPLVVSGSLKKSKGKVRPFKASKTKRTKKSVPPIEEPSRLRARGRSTKKSVDMVINGIDLDVSRIPAPLCTCTGHPQQCYRWGAGGWQSACCTTSISMYPLPMSAKRKGARIAGRKMSQGAFKKVLEKLAGEGQDFSYPIDLKPFWAKHGTNKFVTIR